ncbi:MAG TPA: Ppx/GppA phosphatase family protein [Frankiaceae bacterium]|jgi:exopolyphosphatase/guanosine-5'-triphosphate,3'-diphosphate pyrophosphatase|nr:Ppx/GppA phosphatase family protein [Frankiaceae bacterium]
MTRVAGLDCGTNSLRLLVADLQPDGTLRDVVRDMQVVRLGEGVDRTGELSAAALERTFRVLREYARRCRELGAERVRMVATSATRDARNRDEFTRGVRDILGVDPEVITGEQEAALSFVGATGDLRGRPDLADPYLVVDIGGGSTEFILGGPEGAVASRSVDVGCVRMTERHLHSDPAAAAELQAAEADIASAIADVRRTVDLGATRTLVAVAGTATTMTALALGLPAYDPERIHLSAVSLADVERIYSELAVMDGAQRAALGPMHPGRVDVIVAGALILREVVRAAGTGGMVASEHDILDGITLSLGQP